MAKRIQVGNKVLIRLYNSVDRKYYGYAFTGIIKAIRGKGEKREFLIVRDSGLGEIWVKRKEIRWSSYTTYDSTTGELQ